MKDGDGTPLSIGDMVWVTEELDIWREGSRKIVDIARQFSYSIICPSHIADIQTGDNVIIGKPTRYVGVYVGRSWRYSGWTPFDGLWKRVEPLEVAMVCPVTGTEEYIRAKPTRAQMLKKIEPARGRG